jgi:hypothetical protein
VDLTSFAICAKSQHVCLGASLKSLITYTIHRRGSWNHRRQ